MSSFKFLFDLPAYQAERIPQKIAAGHWRQHVAFVMSSEQLKHLVQMIAIRLVEEGIEKGQCVILYTDRFSIQWLAIDMAIMAAGGISVPLGLPMRDEELQNIFRNIKPSLVVHSLSSSVPNFISAMKSISIDALITNEKPISATEIELLGKIRSTIDANDIATIVHTSGSSGEPRAVALSHHNLISNLLSVLSIVPFTPGTHVMSFLPLSHIFERIVCYVYLACGANIYFLDHYKYALWALKDVRPDYFTSVPLVLERFAAIMEERIEETSWFTRWAYTSWEKEEKGFLSHLGSLIAHQLIIKKWKKKMGGRLKGIVCGAAYLDPKVEKLYERGGIKVRQGYGLTEASPVVCINRFEPGGYKRGTVGQPIPGVEVKIAEDGEILVKGPNIMLGYYGDDAATHQAIKDGWLHTGDIGYLEKDHFLVITDRKSNIYKHASGKFISPSQIESRIIQSPLVSQAMVIGFMRPYTIALIIPDFENLKKICAEKGIHWTAPQYMIHNTMVIQLYRDALDHLGLQSHERIEKFILLPDAWTTENGMLTATYKPRRKMIEERYRKVIDEVYGRFD